MWVLIGMVGLRHLALSQTPPALVVTTHTLQGPAVPKVAVTVQPAPGSPLAAAKAARRTGETKYSDRGQDDRGLSRSRELIDLTGQAQRVEKQ